MLSQVVKEYAIKSSLWSHIMDLGDMSPHEEICGALLGNKETQEIKKYEPLTNVSPTKSCHYIPDPNEWLQTLLKTTFINKKADLDLIGLFHTHPNSAPIASHTDINEAGYEGFYWIYSPKDGTSNFYYYDGNDKNKQFTITNLKVNKETDHER